MLVVVVSVRVPNGIVVVVEPSESTWDGVNGQKRGVDPNRNTMKKDIPLSLYKVPSG